MPPPRVVLIPGLGASARLLDPQRAALPGVEVLGWAPPLDEETLPSYASRLAATVETDGPVYLGGVSFGGMLATEMARLLPCRGLLLIASCLSGRAVAGWARPAGRLLRRLPDRLFRPPRGWARLLTRVSPVSRAQAEALVGMLHEVPPGFVPWGARAICEWPGAGPLAAPLWHIHGDRDPLIPLRSVRPTRVVRGGTHLINVTHAGEVNRFLEEALAEDA